MGNKNVITCKSFKLISLNKNTIMITNAMHVICILSSTQVNYNQFKIKKSYFNNAANI